jgi:hypothetical protein
MLILLEFNDFNLRQSCYFSIHLIYMLILACSFLGFFFFFFVYIHTPLTENGNKDKECQVHAILSLSRQLYQRTDLGDLRTT